MTKMLYLLIFCLLTAPVVMYAQHPETGRTTSAELAEEVRVEFSHAWEGYKQYAWGHDGLKPLSKSSYDIYGHPFYLTAVDALDALVLMGFDKEADSTRNYLERHLSFDQDIYVSTYEFSSRYLGALLATFEMTGDDKLLHLAVDLGDRLLPAFLTGTSMPYAFINLKTGQGRGEHNTPEGIGSYLLEFGTLTALTGDAKYFNTAKIALLSLYEARSSLGLVGDSIDVMTGTWIQPVGHTGRGIEEYYEYLVKCAMFFGDQDCWIMLKSSMEAINAYLLDSTSTGRWYGRADIINGKRTQWQAGAEDASFATTLVLSGNHLAAGSLQKSFDQAWAHFGLVPELFNYRSMKVVSPAFHFDPGMAKSAFHLYWHSLDPEYLKMGRDLLDSMRTYCRVEGCGYADLESVITKEKADRMTSDLLSGIFRYLYLLFSPQENLPYDRLAFTAGGHMLRKTW